MLNKYFRIVLFFIAALTFMACRHNVDDVNAKLSFSTSKLTFDTVFTTVGSTTRHFMVYNNNNVDLEMDVMLAGGSASNFSINVNGVAGTSFQKVPIAAHDSIFVHVKVNVDPGNQNNPFLITDSVLFWVNNRQQDVDLIAYGQDAHFIVADQNLSSSLPYKIVAKEHEVTHWTNDKPYVVYGWAAVDSLGTLIIDPGTQIYFHNGGGLWIYRYGNLQVNGTVDEPVKFQGDRKEKWYSTDYSQWNRIWINEGTEDNIINNAIITNAYIGVQIESLNEYLGNKTIITNSVIQNTANSGVLARGAKLEMTNCQVSNNGACCLQLEIGQFDLKHLTMVSYFSQAVRKYPALYIANAYSSYDNDGNPTSIVGNTSISATNCIAYGNLANEVLVNDHSTKDLQLQLDYTFENCIFKLKESNSHYLNCIFNKDAFFVNENKQDFNLKENSPAIDAGKTTDISYDLLGRNRDSKPDIGAYEYTPTPTKVRY